jgi:hypothetical protein
MQKGPPSVVDRNGIGGPGPGGSEVTRVFGVDLRDNPFTGCPFFLSITCK